MALLKRSVLFVAVAAPVLVACAGSPDAVVSEVGGRWTAVPTVRAGAQDGPGALSPVFDVEVGPNGEMLVGQPAIGTISVFDSVGQFLRSVGRRGPGPGEFGVLGRMGWLADSLWIVDFGRLQLFGPDLEFSRVVTFPLLRPPPGVARLIPGPIMADGSVLGIPAGPDAGRPAPIVLLSEEGEITDTLAHVRQRDPFVRVTVSDDTRPANITDPWIANPIWISEQNGAAILIVDGPVPEAAADASFRITRIGINGDTLLNRRVEYSPIQMTADLLDQTYSEIVARIGSSRSSVAETTIRRAVESAIPGPAFLPPVSGMVLGRDGTIWLRREELRRDSVKWDVLDSAGGALGSLRLPASFSVMRAQRDRIWGIEVDSLDVPYVRVYEIRHAGGQAAEGRF